MTPKLKAEELVKKFSRYVAEKDWFGDSVEKKFSKECALIAVDEMIDHVEMMDDNAAIDFWQEVKTEIENL
jgi:hypothetical protein